MLGLSPGIKISKSGHSIFVLSAIEMYIHRLPDLSDVFTVITQHVPPNQHRVHYADCLFRLLFLLYLLFPLSVICYPALGPQRC